jgi:DNA-binding IscR family transcriptional regulator
VNALVLIDSMVQQVTVLIAQIATSGGLRAPIAHVANQVFVELSRELTAQGIARKVSADMFGMALRAYQRKIKRLTSETGAREQTLWSAVLALLDEHGPLERKALLERFAGDDEPSVRAVLRDLSEAGLIATSGRGPRSHYRLAGSSSGARPEPSAETERGLDELLWVSVHRGGAVSAGALAERLRLPPSLVAARLAALAQLGRLQARGALYETHDFVVPLGSPSGWEAAVLDHVQAVVQTISQRLHGGPVVPRGDEPVGGSTYRFDVWDGHPHAAEVAGALARFREAHAQLRAKVEAYNRSHPRPARYRQVVVYGGQCAYERERLAEGAAEREARKKAGNDAS